jgi:ribosomal-protein-alanine N-acetyltransferase
MDGGDETGRRGTAMSIAIQPAISADAGLIAAMSARLIEYGLPQSWTERRVTTHIGSRNSVVLTARDDGRLVGFAIMHFRDSSAHLNLLAVEPELQRKGIGRRLVEWLEESAIVAGAFDISLETRADNADALNFYLMLGYHETGLAPNYYSGLVDATLMARDLRVNTQFGDSLIQ